VDHRRNGGGGNQPSGEKENRQEGERGGARTALYGGHPVSGRAEVTPEKKHVRLSPRKTEEAPGNETSFFKAQKAVAGIKRRRPFQADV